VVFVVKNAVPYASRQQGSHFFADKVVRLLFQSRRIGDINDVSQFFLADTSVIV